MRTIFVEVPGRRRAERGADGSRRSSTSGSPGSRCRRSGPRSPSGCATPADASGGRRAAQHLHRRGRGALRPRRTSRARWCSGSAQLLADQPEFASNARMRELLGSPRGATCCAGARSRGGRRGLSITIGGENPDPRLAIHAGHRLLPRPATSAASSASWDRPACRTTRSSGWWSTPAAWWKDCWSERFLRPAGRRARRVRGRHQEGLPQAGDGVPPRPESGARRRGEVQGDHRGVRGAPRSAEARGLRPLRQGGPRRRRRRVRVPPRRPDRGAQHLHARLRRDGRLRVALRRRRAAAPDDAPGPGHPGDGQLTLAEVATGVKKTVKLKTLERCATCEGSGAKPGTKPTACTTCGGSGEVRRAARSMFGQFVSVAPCPTCGGEGSVIREPCEVCRGEGRVRAERTVHGGDPRRRLHQQLPHAARPGRGRAAQRPERRPARDARGQGRRAVRAPGRRPDLRPAALVLPGGARRRVHGADAVRRGAARDCRRAPRPSTVLRLKGKGLPCSGRAARATSTSGCTSGRPSGSPTSRSGSSASSPSSRASRPSASPGFWSKLKEALGA